jgi:chromosome segregation ATPase
LRYWQKAQPFSVREKLKDLGDHITKIEKENDSLAQTIDDLKKDMVKRMDSVDASLTLLTGNVGEVKKETVVIEKHVDDLEAKTDVATKKVEDIRHQVDVDVSELRRIDSQKDSMSKVDQNAQQIKYLADEVRDLEHEVIGSSRKHRDFELRPE